MSKRAFLFNTYAGAVRAAVAISKALGYPKLEGVPVDPSSPPARMIAFYARPRRVPVGHPLAAGGTGGVLILDVDRPAILALHGTSIPVPATYLGRPVPGGAGTMNVNVNAGIAFNRDQHDVEEEDF